LNPLDSPAFSAVDASGMFGHIERLGAELEIAWAAHGTSPIAGLSPSSLTLAGMGGSASAADYFTALVSRTAAVPISVVRDYRLPGHVGPGSLLAAVSYSGTTEEALACHSEALERGASTFAVTSGGDLAALARSHGQPLCKIGYVAPPRAALAHMLAPLLGLAPLTRATAFTTDDIGAAASAHRALVENALGRTIPTAANAAKQAALAIGPDTVPVIFAAEHLTAAAQRGKNQFAENAKTLAVFEEVPESTHNTVVSLEATSGARQVALAFDSPLLGPGNRRRIEITARLYEERGFPFHRFTLSGRSLLADLWEATAVTDFVSCYLAVLRGIDPTPTPNLTRVRTQAAAEAV